MPTIQQNNRIDISPDRFINACDQTELYELDLLLGKKLSQIDSQTEELLPEEINKMTLKSVLEHCLEYGVGTEAEGISCEVQNRIKQYLQ